MLLSVSLKILNLSLNRMVCSFMKNNLGYLQENAGATTQELWNGCLFDKRALFLSKESALFLVFQGFSPFDNLLLSTIVE